MSMIKYTSIIRKRRQSLNMSQKECAKLLGISQQHLDRYEKGHPLPLYRLNKIACVLQTNIHDLLPDEWRHLHVINAQLLENIIATLDKNMPQHSIQSKSKITTLTYQELHYNNPTASPADITTTIQEITKSL